MRMDERLILTEGEELVLPEALDACFRTPSVWPELSALSGGTNLRRRRLQPSAFLAYRMPTSPMEAQLKTRELSKRVKALKAHHRILHEANATVLPATLERLFA
ncbi:hypothetical protein RHOFW510R12_19980 [Rhodanobacter sp. FW510-R12]